MIAMQKNDMGMVWEVQSAPYLTHIYGKDIPYPTIPILGNYMGYGNGMGWLPCEGIIWEWYGSYIKWLEILISKNEEGSQ